MIYVIPFHTPSPLVETSRFWVVYDRSATLVPVVVVTSQYNCHTRELHYVTITVREVEILEGGGMGIGVTLVLFL